MFVRTVELFLDVASCRSFSKAADANGISQSSVSQSVAQLEKRLGVELIDRTKRPLELTAAGQRYFEGCRELLDQSRELEDSVQSIANKVTGRLRVAAIYSVGLSQLDRYVGHFQRLFPEVELHVDFLHPEEVYDRVRSDMADLGLVSFPREGGEFACIPWQEERFVAVVPPGHPFALRAQAGVAKLEVTELDGQTFVALTSDLKVRRETDRWFKQYKINVKVAFEFDNIETVRRAVEDGLGMALLPAPTVARSVETGTLIQLELADVDWIRPLGVIHKRHRRLSNAAESFIKLLKENPEDLPKPEPAAAHSDRKRNARRPKASA